MYGDCENTCVKELANRTEYPQYTPVSDRGKFGDTISPRNFLLPSKEGNIFTVTRNPGVSTLSTLTSCNKPTFMEQHLPSFGGLVVTTPSLKLKINILMHTIPNYKIRTWDS